MGLFPLRGVILQLDITRIKPAEIPFAFDQDEQLDSRSGCIGRLQGDFGAGREFHAEWFDHQTQFKTHDFGVELNKVVHALRAKGGCGLLADRHQMAAFCARHPETALGTGYAARSVIEALADGTGPQIVYVGNTLSANAMNRMLRQLEGKRFAVDCIAKNFETLEPGASFRVLRRELAARYAPAEAAVRIICTGTEGSSLEELCTAERYTFLPFLLNVGGRYTAMTYVGLLPMAVAGIDIRTLVRGAAEMEQTLRTGVPEDNLALRYAVLRNLYYQRGYKLELLASFEPQFRWFYKWWVQLFAESEGKAVYPGRGAPDVRDLPGCGGPAGQPCGHAGRQGRPLRDYLNGKDFYDINKAAFSATVTAHSQKLPCLIFGVPALDAYNFGQLFYFFQFVCYISGSILGINPFNQPGVEAYKGWMFKALESV